MAEATLPAPRRTDSWLDRPFAPTWQRIAGLAINWEIAAYTTLVLLGLVIRIWDVGSRAMHHDESLHAYYAWQLYDGKGYSYDPLMHGPLQFEVVPVFYLLFGDSEFSARLLAVLLGTVLIALPYFLRRYLTSPGALAASLMLTVSPAFVYFSRFIRDDIYLACFTLLIFICLVRYLESPRPYWLYVASAAAALALASMEAAYMTFFIFGTFLLAQGLREWLTRPGPVIAALRATSMDTWLMVIAIFVVLTVLFYSTFFTNPYGIWDTRYGFHGLLNSARKDILGGLTYWKAQHYVQRGGQPWFYYLLLLPLYEQLALLFGLAGIALSVLQRSLFRTFLVWWAVMAYGLYTWAGEKMPWLVIHIALPLIILGGVAIGTAVRSRRIWVPILVGSVGGLLLVLEIHSTFLLNFKDGANPTEMLIYVQTSQDVPNVVHEISTLPGWPNLPIGLDDTDVGGWPFTWYLRHDPAVTESATFNGPVCGGQYCPVLLMLEPQYTQFSAGLMRRYVVQKYRWNWWFPEDYKQWFPDHCGATAQSPNCNLGSLPNLLGTSDDWLHVWNWLIYRQPFGDRAARDLYVFVRRDLVPGAKYFSTKAPSGTLPPPPATSFRQLPTRLMQTLSGGSTPLYGPRGVAADGKGNVYVADTLNHRIVAFSPTGAALRSWGSAGTGRGQFSPRDSPQSLAVGPDHLIYTVDTWNQRIEVFTASGKLVRTWGGGPIGSGPGQFYGPRSVAVAPSGRVFVADTGNKRIQVFTRTGKYLFSIGSAGSGQGQFNEPSSVAIGRSGRLYVADFWNQRIQVFTLSGTYLSSWKVPDWTAGSYDEPYLSVDQSNGNVLASDPHLQQVLEYAPGGRLLGAIRDASLSVPIGITVAGPGRVAVSEPAANHVLILQVSAAPRQRPAGSSPTARVTPKRP